jgi:hypothetical protein
VPAEEAMITFFSSRVIGRDRSRTFVIESIVAILLAPCVSGNLTGRLFSKSACVSLILLWAKGPLDQQ